MYWLKMKEVVMARVAVGHAMAQDVPHCDEDGVGDDRDHFLVPTPASQTVISRRQGAVAGAHSTPYTRSRWRGRGSGKVGGRIAGRPGPDGRPPGRPRRKVVAHHIDLRSR